MQAGMENFLHNRIERLYFVVIIKINRYFT